MPITEPGRGKYTPSKKTPTDLKKSTGLCTSQGSSFDGNPGADRRLSRSFIGLGYVAVENWQYLGYLTPIEAYARGFASPVIHMLFASIWGYWVGCAYLQGRSLIIAAIAGLAIAASLHGLYDFIVILSPHNSLLIAAAGIVAIWVWRLKLMHKMHEDASQDR